ncbi:hypothetical protein GCM10011351_32020 [Paraliobacillus quinghaiensis]|uniref:Uncharacterized protein n=1 Tax=Paraliobacillus quinghaiensis TaxID=470815 RepID=A0A917WZL5_9BACI|nr:hypothetical protein [Paraliobacillus quinghaiensis]GGM43640.1 hypothetical protein GCM10011351_32020 [Paraliobacillus quinghaiensis]
MIRSKVALISSAIILGVCLYLYFPFHNNVMIGARTTFMSFPIRNHDGYILLGVIGSVLFIIAMILLVIGLKKYHFRILIVVAVVYAMLPNILITAYQETFASGIAAISYDGNGKCNFESVSTDLLNGECNLVLHNRSNEAVSFELEFIDSYFMEDGVRMESLMNLAGPYSITLEANREKHIYFKELIELSGVPKHIEMGSSSNIHFKLICEEKTRTL